MFVDGRKVASGRTFQSDVCVIGAGAAGITLATALGAAGLKVDLVESGGFALDSKTQSLYETGNVGANYPPTTLSRLRYFGGTTNHWGGVTHPLDAFELERHAWVPDSGWPIEHAEIAPYYARVGGLLGLEEPAKAETLGEADRSQAPRLFTAGGSDFEPVVWRMTQPTATRIGPDHRAAVGQSAEIRCVHHTNASQLVPNETGKWVKALLARTLNRRALVFHARRFVLCTGAIENARLLLCSDSVVPEGLGNQNDLVGRYFADHAFRAGRILVTRASPSGAWRELPPDSRRAQPDRRPDVAGYATSRAFRERKKLLGFAALWLEGLPLGVDETGTVFESLTETLPDAFPDARTKPIGTASLILIGEKSPNRLSRVHLSTERDALGMRRAVVDLKLDALDWRSLDESAHRFALAVGESGNGRVQLSVDEKRWCPGIGGHQTGTTRMSADPKQGVTDAFGRVHGLSNLYVTGGSLFPTNGWQHPTLTIFALAARLADHLKAAQRNPIPA